MALGNNKAIAVGRIRLQRVDPQNVIVENSNYVCHREVAADVGAAGPMDHLQREPLQVL